MLRCCEGTTMDAITLDLHHDNRIKLFSFRMPVREACAQIKQQPNIYDAAHVKYFDEKPLKLNIILHLNEIFDVKRLEMRYFTSFIGRQSTLAVFVTDRGIYTLFYLSISFAFPIPSRFTNYCHDDEGVKLPLEFLDGTTPVTCCVSIYDSSSSKKVGGGSLMNEVSALPSQHLHGRA
ncbi:UPF0183 protein, partial [Mucuna pruriens]